MIGKLKSLWARFWLRKSKFTGRYGDLRRLYAVKDPWGLSGAKEQQRFAATNDLIRSLAPGCQSLLELGCGEGFQTAWLLEISETVAGLDVSEKAVARARSLCPSADLRVGKAEDIGKIFAGRRFDVVTAFEVLYYSDDVARVLGEIQAASDCLLVTNYAERAARMQANFEGPGWSRLPDIAAQGTTWECHVWRPVRSPAEPPT